MLSSNRQQQVFVLNRQQPISKISKQYLFYDACVVVVLNKQYKQRYDQRNATDCWFQFAYISTIRCDAWTQCKWTHHTVVGVWWLCRIRYFGCGSNRPNIGHVRGRFQSSRIVNVQCIAIYSCWWVSTKVNIPNVRFHFFLCFLVQVFWSDTLASTLFFCNF